MDLPQSQIHRFCDLFHAGMQLGNLASTDRQPVDLVSLAVVLNGMEIRIVVPWRLIVLQCNSIGTLPSISWMVCQPAEHEDCKVRAAMRENLLS